MAKKTSITTNFIFNILLTLSTYIAQLIVYPYVSRVLGVDNMGVIGFVNKTIDIFLIFSSLGIHTVGIREIAAVRNNRDELSRVFSNLVTFVVLSTFVVSLVYIGAILWITQFNIYSDLFLIGICKLIFSTFLIEWFYQGVEDFRFITLRSVSVKILYVIAVFVFVKQRSDVSTYFILTTAVVVLNSLLNWIVSRKYVKYRFVINDLKRFSNPMFTYGLYQMLNATFSTLNYVFLGFLTTKAETGYYYTAENFYFILLAAISAFTRVMLPRMSSLLASDRKEEFNGLIDKSFDAVLAVCIPIAIYGIFFAPGIICLFSGAGYEGAVIPMQIMMALILINSINQILIIQVATPLKLDKEILIGTAVATVAVLSSNYFVVKAYGAIGCSLVLVISVVIANVYPIYCLLKRKYMEFPVKIVLRQMLLASPYILISAAVVLFSPQQGIIPLALAGTGFAIYFLLLPGKPYVSTYWQRFISKTHS